MDTFETTYKENILKDINNFKEILLENDDKAEIAKEALELAQKILN